MSLPDPITSRLQRQTNLIARMLHPGSKRLRENRGLQNFSPVAQGFGGKKFEQAAQKMRILDKASHINVHLEKTKNMAGTIQAKFQNARSLLRLSAWSAAGVSRSWSPLDRVFPGGQPAARGETPLAPGELRQGSIIQKFSTFPAQGQPLESFKEQVQRSPVAAKTVAPAPKKANLSPKDKLFSRVQEISSGQKEKKNIQREILDGTVKPAIPVTDEPIQRKVEPVIQTPDVQAAQRKAEPAIQAPDVQPAAQPRSESAATQMENAATTPALPEGESAKKEEHVPLPETRAPLQNQITAFPSSDSPNPVIQREIESNLPLAAQQHVPGQGMPPVAHTTKPEPPRALPLQKAKPVQRKLPAALPVSRAEKSAGNKQAVSNEIQRAVAPNSQPVSNNADQRLFTATAQPDTSAPPVARPFASVAPVNQPLQRKPDIELPDVPQVENRNAPLEAQASPEIHEREAPEMPLKQHLDHKQAAVQSLRMDTSRVKPVSTGATLQLTRNLVQRRLTPPATVMRFDELRRMPMQPSPRASASESMPLQRAFSASSAWQSVKSAGNKVGSTYNRLSSSVKSKMNFLDNTINGAMDVISDPVGAAYAEAKERLQKMNPADGADVEAETTPSTNVAARSSRLSRPVDAAALAERVFPFVKRLLELEFERTGIRFRR